MTRRPSFPARLDNGAAGRPPVPRGSAPAAQRPPAVAASPAAPAKPSAKSSISTPARPPGPTGLGLDSQAVRTRMVDKLAAQGIADARVLAAMRAVERHRFVDSALVNQAYEDTSLPIGLGQTISKPNVVARMIELLLGGRTGPDGRLGRVLEVGTGCGYQAAVLACVASEVYSIERLRGLHDKAVANLRPLRLPNVHLLFGDGMAGDARGAPYAGIIAAAGGEAIPRAWTDQLGEGGRIVAPMVVAGGRQALVIVEKSAGHLRQSVLESVHFVPLKSGVA